MFGDSQIVIWFRGSNRSNTPIQNVKRSSSISPKCTPRQSRKWRILKTQPLKTVWNSLHDNWIIKSLFVLPDVPNFEITCTYFLLLLYKPPTQSRDSGIIWEQFSYHPAVIVVVRYRELGRRKLPKDASLSSCQYLRCDKQTESRKMLFPYGSILFFEKSFLKWWKIFKKFNAKPFFCCLGFD